MYRKIAIATLVAAICCSAYADRVSATQKGSVLIYPKIEVRWDAAGNLIQDTFVSIMNDNTAAVHLVCYWVNETCEQAYFDIDLTKNEPEYFSAATGVGSMNVLPFFGFDQAYPDPDGSTDMVIPGYLIVIAANDLNQQIRWNHLAGVATIVNYSLGAAWEYNSYAFQALIGSTGDVVGTPGEIQLNGTDYDYGFDQLLLDFVASGATAFSNGGITVTHETDLTLMILNQDLRQETEGPFITKAFFRIWNQDEMSCSNEYCVLKWDQSLISKWGGCFLLANLQTPKGRARIDGLESDLCDIEDPTDPNSTIYSAAYSLLGVEAKILTFANGDIAYAGTNLAGTGEQAACIKYDVLTEPPPEKVAVPAPAAVVPGIRR